jgi:RNA polymerase sigma-70 factor (ECF subfamily)
MECNQEIMLVNKAKEGDKSSYEELIRAYGRLIWSVIYGIIHDPAGTEDLVQETFIKAWQSIKALREPSSFRGWLVMIARRKALQHNELLKRREKTVDDLVSYPVKAESSDESGNEELRRQLHWALRQLPDRYRMPLTLRYLEGFNYRQIADNLGITDGSLRGLLNRGMQLLKETMKEVNV